MDSHLHEIFTFVERTIKEIVNNSMASPHPEQSSNQSQESQLSTEPTDQPAQSVQESGQAEATVIQPTLSGGRRGYPPRVVANTSAPRQPPRANQQPQTERIEPQATGRSRLQHDGMSDPASSRSSRVWSSEERHLRDNLKTVLIYSDQTSLGTSRQLNSPIGPVDQGVWVEYRNQSSKDSSTQVNGPINGAEFRQSYQRSDRNESSSRTE